jgi:hypothetical protein
MVAHIHGGTRLRVFENWVLRGILGPSRVKVNKSSSKDYITRSFMTCIPHQILLGWVGHVARKRERRGA